MYIYFIFWVIIQHRVMYYVFNSSQLRSLGALSVSSCVITVFSQKKKKKRITLPYFMALQNSKQTVCFG